MQRRKRRNSYQRKQKAKSDWFLFKQFDYIDDEDCPFGLEELAQFILESGNFLGDVNIKRILESEVK